MSTATATPRHESGVRVINGRRIEKHVHGEAVRWLEVTRRPPIERPVYDAASGTTSSLIEHQAPQVVQVGAIDPAAITRIIGRTPADEFDPRPPDALNSQLERAEAAGFGELATAFRMTAKVKGRQVLKLLFPLGRCLVLRDIQARQIGAEEWRQYIARHAAGDHGVIGHIDDVPELTDDQEWCPPLGGQIVVNKAAILTGSGLVESVYPVVFQKTRGTEHVKITSYIGQCTVMRTTG